MGKQICYMHYLIEEAPSPVISPHKASHAPMLETIIEESTMESKMEIATKSKAAYLLPIILSFITYVLMKRLSVV